MVAKVIVQAAIIVHELSHFGLFRGTDDHAYDLDDCLMLASTHPHKAVKNACSIASFAVNDISMLICITP